MTGVEGRDAQVEQRVEGYPQQLGEVGLEPFDYLGACSSSHRMLAESHPLH